MTTDPSITTRDTRRQNSEGNFIFSLESIELYFKYEDRIKIFLDLQDTFRHSRKQLAGSRRYKEESQKEMNMDPRKQGSRQENGKVNPRKTEKVSPR